MTKEIYFVLFNQNKKSCFTYDMVLFVKFYLDIRVSKIINRFNIWNKVLLLLFKMYF